MVQLKWGICSAGLISFDFTDALYSLPDEEHKLIAVAARDLERAKQFAKQFEIPKAYSSYTELANDPEVQIVYIGATQNTHYELCKLFLNAGKHVLCEKALVCAAWQAEDLIALAKSKKLFFMEAMWTRCFPFYRKLREVIESGELGKVHFVEVHFQYDSRDVQWSDRLTNPDAGGGVTWDMGVYALQFADFAFGGEKPLKVNAVGTLNEKGVDVSANYSLQYSEGRFASLLVSAVSPYYVTALVQGTEAKLVVEEPFYTPLRYTITRRNGEKRVIDSDPLPEVKFPTKYTNSAGLVHEARHVREMFIQGKLESDLVPHHLSLWLQQTFDEVLRQLGRTNLPQRDGAKA